LQTFKTPIQSANSDETGMLRRVSLKLAVPEAIAGIAEGEPATPER
jgi:hypothetical protein